MPDVERSGGKVERAGPYQDGEAGGQEGLRDWQGVADGALTGLGSEGRGGEKEELRKSKVSIFATRHQMSAKKPL